MQSAMKKEEMFEIIDEYMERKKKEAKERGLLDEVHAPAISTSSSLIRYDLENRERIIRLEVGIENIVQLIKQGFEERDKRLNLLQEQMNKRFEQIDKRFEQIDKRFEQIDKRFESMQEQMDKRFEQVDKRFESMQEQMDKRFDHIYSFMRWQTGLGFMMLAGLYLKLFLG